MGWKKNKKAVADNIKKDYRLDFPTDEDLLGYSDYAESIAEIIRTSNNKNTPLTIGVFGQWGAGKSSFLKMVEKLINPDNDDKKYISIKFNAWKYENEENLLAALLQLILNQVNNINPLIKRWILRIKLWSRKIIWKKGGWELFQIILKVLIVMGIEILVVNKFLPDELLGLNIAGNPILINLLLIVSFYYQFDSEIIKKVLNINFDLDFSKLLKENSYEEHISFLDKFNDEFQEIIKILSPENPIIIYIDDLDRCFPEKTIDILEILKTFLDVENLIFIIAVDPIVIENVVYQKYNEINNSISKYEISEVFSGKDYFEKIIQLPIQLPAVSTSNIEMLVKNLYENEDFQFY